MAGGGWGGGAVSIRSAGADVWGGGVERGDCGSGPIADGRWQMADRVRGVRFAGAGGGRGGGDDDRGDGGDSATAGGLAADGFHVWGEAGGERDGGWAGVWEPVRGVVSDQ